jgi:acid phosphatase type 7
LLCRDFVSEIAQVLPGNHEGECHSPICLLNDKYKEALRNFTAYNARFRMPAPESGP